MDYLIFIVSLAVLIIGADFIIRESERIALHFDIPAFIIGATLIAVVHLYLRWQLRLRPLIMIKVS